LGIVAYGYLNLVEPPLFAHECHSQWKIMPKTTKSENVPESMRAKFEELSRLTDHFCKEHLNDEYAQLCRYLTAALCRKRPSPCAVENQTLGLRDYSRDRHSQFLV